jgi:hypothetical protein
MYNRIIYPTGTPGFNIKVAYVVVVPKNVVSHQSHRKD